MSDSWIKLEQLVDIATRYGMKVVMYGYGSKRQGFRYECYLQGNEGIISTPKVGHDSLEEGITALVSHIGDRGLH